MRHIAPLLLLAGCSVVDAPYPPAWDPLPSRLDSSALDCRRFQGTYADRGEAPDQSAKPSLTRELLGQDSPWEKATSVRFNVVSDDVVEVTVNGAKPMTHQFSVKAGDLSCERGRLVLRSRRWVTSDLMSGRENVKIDLHQSEPYLVAHVYENTTGLMFMVVPLSGESARWFRFQRVAP
jgi:hypothetical protein